MAMVDAPIL
jgi:hypothetical protein